MLTKEYPDLAALLATLDLHDEYDYVRALMAGLAHVREQGFFTKDELLRVCKWKEPRERMRRHWLANSEEWVQVLTGAALATPNEIERMHHLTQLKGVGVQWPQRCWR